MTTQFPAFRVSVAGRMEGHRQRLAQRIRSERKRRGENPTEVAVAIGVAPRTSERWEAGERDPQDKKLKALADYWKVDVSELRPDLEAEERALRNQLSRIEDGQARIEGALDGLSARLEQLAEALTPHLLDEAAADLEDAVAEVAPTPGRRRSA